MYSVITERDGRTMVDFHHKWIRFRKPGQHDGKRQYRFVQVKGDGYRVLVIKVPDANKLEVITTSGHDEAPRLEQCPWYHQLCKRMGDLQWFDGEIFLPGDTAENLKTAIVASDKRIEFQAFGFSQIPWDANLSMLDTICDHHKIKQLPWQLCRTPDYEQSLLATEYERQEQALENVRKLGCHYDGVVFKDGIYDAWAKMKHRKTIDLVVQGFQPGRGKYAGMVGSLLCGIGEIEIARVGGMNDAARVAITEADLGRVVEVEYERVASQGRLRHPRFLRWRDDKLPEHCKLDQDPKLYEKHTAD